MGLTYRAFVDALVEFGLITKEQGYAWLEREAAELKAYHSRRDAFFDSYVDRRPWWKRWFGRSAIYEKWDAWWALEKGSSDG